MIFLVNPKYPKATEYSRNNFVRDIESFDQLEEKISALPDGKTEGDAFEVLAEAYLAAQGRYYAQDIGPLNAAPTSLLSRVSLRNENYGYHSSIVIVFIKNRGISESA